MVDANFVTGPVVRRQMMSNLYNGRFSDSEAFRAFLERFFEQQRTLSHNRWWVRDWLSTAWDAGLDAAFGEELTKEDLIKRADAVDEIAEGVKKANGWRK